MNKKIMLFMVITVILAVVAASLPMPVEADDGLTSDEAEFILHLSSQITKAGIMVSKYRAWMKSLNNKMLWFGFIASKTVGIPPPSFPAFGDCGLTGNIPNTIVDIADLWNSQVCSEFNFIDRKINSLNSGTDLIDFTIGMFQIRGSLNHIESSLSRIEGLIAKHIAKLEKKVKEDAKKEFTEDSGDGGDQRDNGDKKDGDDTSDCFIATAAYGTPKAVEIDELRRFRDEYLRKSSFGNEFIEFYYEHSPPIARYISEHEILRVIVREGFVEPVVKIVKFTENYWSE